MAPDQLRIGTRLELSLAAVLARRALAMPIGIRRMTSTGNDAAHMNLDTSDCKLSDIAGAVRAGGALVARIVDIAALARRSRHSGTTPITPFHPRPTFQK